VVYPLGCRRLPIRARPGALVYRRVVALLEVPPPYDFELSTYRFRAYGPDLVTAWHDGGLHRVVDGTVVRIAAASGGVDVSPLEVGIRPVVAHLLGLGFDTAGFWEAAGEETVLASLRPRLEGFRPPLAPDPWEALVTSICAQQVSLHAAFAIRARLVERYGTDHGGAWSFPARERVAALREGELVALGFSRRKAEYVVGLARGDLDLDALASLGDDEVIARLTAVRGLGRWTAEWFLARALGRQDAWPAGDLGLRRAVERLYGGGRAMTEAEVRALGERFAGRRTLAAQVLLAGARIGS
jgi:DNA-3-methyladenine glycosylase II